MLCSTHPPQAINGLCGTLTCSFHKSHHVQPSTGSNKPAHSDPRPHPVGRTQTENGTCCSSSFVSDCSSWKPKSVRHDKDWETNVLQISSGSFERSPDVCLMVLPRSPAVVFGSHGLLPEKATPGPCRRGTPKRLRFGWKAVKWEFMPNW